MKGFGLGAVLGVLACAALYLWMRDRASETAGRYEREIATLDSTIQYHRSHRDVVHDTVRVASADARASIARYRRLRDSLNDGLRVVQDTAQPVPSTADSTATRLIITHADSAISACERFLTACIAGLRTDSLLIRDLPRRIAVTDKARTHDRRRALLEKIAWAAGGYFVGRVTR